MHRVGVRESEYGERRKRTSGSFPIPYSRRLPEHRPSRNTKHDPLASANAPNTREIHIRNGEKWAPEGTPNMLATSVLREAGDHLGGGSIGIGLLQKTKSLSFL